MKTCLDHGETTSSRPRNEKGKQEMKGKLSTLGLMLMLSAVIFAGLGAAPIHAAIAGTYTVQPGDMMITIAARHGVSVSELAGANGLSWNSWVYVGQRLSIPGFQPGPSTVYVVQRGDTLSSIARRFGTTIKSIMSTNQLFSTRIYVGQRLVIPGSTPQTVDNWMGRIVNLFGSQYTHCFERSDGQRFGIGSVDDALGRRIEELRWSGQQFRVWGTLRTDVPSYGGQYVAVQWLEIVSGPGGETRNLTPLATVSASSHLRTDRYGQYQSWMAVDGARDTAWVEGVAGPGIGQWLTLTFRGTIECGHLR
jgi:LysM repeat protein